MSHLTRFTRLFFLCFLLLAIPTLYLLYPSPQPAQTPTDIVEAYEAGGIDSPHWRPPIKPDYELEEGRDWEDEVILDRPVSAEGEKGWMNEVVGGGVIMPKLGNETAKAELGRAAWRVLHLMTLRYPDNPTPDDRSALKSYFHLFSRLYPCGECAQEFQLLLKEYPPQTSSRKTASLWLCHIHNLVNARLGKPEFDCLTLDATYDCGCGDESSTSVSISSTPTPTSTSISTSSKGPMKWKVSGFEEDTSDDGMNDDWKSTRPSSLFPENDWGHMPDIIEPSWDEREE
ncbi:thiol oxidase [Tremella mesenterica]|uniref:Sulfhydryl oxidase n=1 Tax=Tremella mesenterica TaxID=5217 RepID=A0A4Q1BG75_TREME|nr:thiol oxidase [Tremella mesenterica]